MVVHSWTQGFASDPCQFVYCHVRTFVALFYELRHVFADNKMFMGVVKAQCKPMQNTEIETITVKCAFDVG